MAEAFSTAPTASRRRMQTRTIVSLGLVAFLLGSVATWVLAGSPGLPSFDLFTLKSEPEIPAPAPAPTALQAAPSGAGQAAELEEIAETQGGIDQRVAAMEQRRARLDLQTQAAAGNTGRAAGLLNAFAARRAVERGSELGVLADQLRLRIGDAQPNAVRPVIAASRNPIRRDQLIARLDSLGPDLA